jgi:hypothetical protein
MWGMCLFCVDARLVSGFFVAYLAVLSVTRAIEGHSKMLVRLDLFSRYADSVGPSGM